MMRSLYSGVSGLQNHQTRMDVVGNNIANVNTIGFKKGRVNFQDMISQSISGASRPTDGRGGVNPKQVGLGMSVATIDTIHTQGSFQSTQKASDLGISGNGFFILRDGNNSFYTRAGAFDVDSNRRLVNPANGMRIQGWMAKSIGGEQVINTSADVEDLVIPIGDKEGAKATEHITFACNLDKRLPIIEEGASEVDVARGTWVVNKTIYDSFGNTSVVELRVVKDTTTPNLWNATVLVNGETNSSFTIGFNNEGALLSLNGQAGQPGDLLEFPITFGVVNANAGEVGEQQTINLRLGNVGSYTDSITQFADASTTKAIIQDGYGMGYMENYEIDQNGIIMGVYSNGIRRDIGKIALASFVNPGGLAKVGDTNFTETSNSGQVRIGETGLAGLGSIRAGVLEMANVDLAEQFTDMIVTQRGFQANAKTITTSDQLLQELVRLKN
ncbi:flagellar hook protein FlgE [Borrelia parkeri]|uniref:Flagellar hook protein FlgE n=1 Tax=Borrelia parkeri SLO TaxID=1313294 RepID=A0ABN4C6H5_BORPR|nr:flagellar hook protein FlgE [Borrelia parkeri]AHE62617.1 flagellar hook protein FlgE [Borrelia parkeri HR1]AHH09650.1 Flagellar hook protein flgE [Borrelia parkeri SLO]UPA10462.1 flagellar hook protein FlgE [Borrelia parkeri]